MRNLIIFETADEFVKCAYPHRVDTDDRPFVPMSEVTLVIDNGVPRLQDPKQRFQLDSSITEDQIITAMAKACFIKVHIT